MSMEELDGLAWLDGAVVPWRSATVHPLSYTFQTGVGVFEGTRAYETKQGAAIFRLRDHVSRLFESAKILGMEIDLSRDEMMQAHIEIVRANKLKSCYIRTNVYFDGRNVGVSAAGNGVHVAIFPWTWDAYLGAEAAERGIRVCTASYSRHSVKSTLLRAKANGHYVNSMLAISEARRGGFDDALLLDTNGYVAECSTSNVFMIKDGAVSTPPSTDILLGITRDTVIALFRRMGIEVVERRLTRDELYCADEVFITGTAAEIVPVVSYDGRDVASGVRGLLTGKIQDGYRDVVEGRAGNAEGWLAYVEKGARDRLGRA